MKVFSLLATCALLAVTNVQAALNCGPVFKALLGPEKAAIMCYSSIFLRKMLGELKAGNKKTVQHVRAHLLPYLGDVEGIEALKTDSPDDPLCTACYSDADTSSGLMELRASVPEEELAIWTEKKLHKCYAVLTEKILAGIPQSSDGVFLVAPTMREKEFITYLFVGEVFKGDWDMVKCEKKTPAPSSQNEDFLAILD
eukprot:GDKH01005498.1.p1 GENE.GDKH01005498.1~~GDKH01005498.1.p1  ORF type:complete len:198 (+),score=51.76 GDKH01005498.1:137-730(+)